MTPLLELGNKAHGGLERWNDIQTVVAADEVAFGRLFIANPDLVKRMRLGFDFNAPDRTTFYGGDAHGYTDHPIWTPAKR